MTRTREDIFPVLQYLAKRLFPFNYVVPGAEHQLGLRIQVVRRKDAAQAHARADAAARVERTTISHPSENQFSAESYRIIHFVVDMPVRLPKRILDRAPAAAVPLGNVIFVICEFQIVDRDTETHNELGDASHAKYKERQKKAVMRRLQLGGTGEVQAQVGDLSLRTCGGRGNGVERRTPCASTPARCPPSRPKSSARSARPEGRSRPRSPKEVEADVAAVLNQYLADERDVNERAKDVLERTGKPQTEFQRVRALVADEKGIKVGDETLDYLLDQVVEMLMHSNNVDEVFVEDVDLRRTMAPVFKKHMAVDSTARRRGPRPAPARARRDARLGDRVRQRPRAGEAPQGAVMRPSGIAGVGLLPGRESS